MVAPLIAAAARGAAARGAANVASTGGKWMHSTSRSTRKMGSKMLGYGGEKGGEKLLKEVKGLSKKANMNLKYMGKIANNVAKFVNFMSKFSPALKQQTIVMTKAFGLFLRPIGDIMAKFMRPMSLWVMKVAMKWYSIFGSKTAGEPGEGGPDIAEQLITQAQAAEAAGELEKAERLRSEAASMISKPDIQEEDSGFSKIFGKLIPESFKESLSALGKTFKELWNVIVEVGKILWDVLGPALTSIGNIIGLAVVGALKLITFLFEGIAFVLKMLAKGLETAWDLIKIGIDWIDVFSNWIGEKLVGIFIKLWDSLKSFSIWISDIFTNAWSSILTTMKTVYNWILNTFIGIFESLKNAMSGVWDTIKGLISKLKFWKKNDDEHEPKAVGGEITETKPYLLHAGERVIPAGVNSRISQESQSSVFNIVNNITATINNDLDIRELARKLSDLNEIELRRRVSYI